MRAGDVEPTTLRADDIEDSATLSPGRGEKRKCNMDFRRNTKDLT